ncbi:MAG: LamG domain-containing protein [Sedimentisphaerales bacterium]|nr:LamG domain-containing protein [Sedimentisphaerales bacterium]
MNRKVFIVITLVWALTIPVGSVKADLTTGLVGYWPLDGDAEDVSGNGNNGTIVGDVVPVADRFGTADSAMNFPGDRNNYIDLGQPDVLLIKGAMTVAAWVRAETMLQNGRVVAKQGPSSGRSWSIQLESSGGFARFDVGVSPTERIRADSDALSYGPDEWFHMAGVFRPGESVEIYLDGELAKREPTAETVQWIENDLPINIGRRPEPGTPWDGDIDEVYIYNVALSPEDVQDLMNAGSMAFPKARGPSPADGAVHEDTWVNLSWTAGDYAVSHDVYMGDNLAEVEDATRDAEVFRGNQTATFFVAGFPGFAFPDGLVGGTTYYWRIDEINEDNPDSPWKGDVWSFTVPPKTAYAPNPADGAEFVGPDDVTLSWTAGFGAKLHTVFLGNDYDEVNDATVGILAGNVNYKPGSLEREKVYYWRVDESDGLVTYKGDIWAFTTPGAAGAPQPANGAEDAEQAPILTWTPAETASSHQVYFGMDKEAVNNATVESAEYKGNKTSGAESYDPGPLEWNVTYYWRVDAVYSTHAVKGLVWRFTTANFLVVEDFESYTDDDTAGLAIWQAWIDGYGIPDNGAQVGYLLPPYAEQSIVHGGAQSMPLLYDNTLDARNSEATLTLSASGGLRDWTTGDVAELSLWFRGSPTNATEPLYVAVSNAAGTPVIVAHDDSTAAKKSFWSHWTIPLQTFADQGINLTNVDTIAIGLGSKAGSTTSGGSGTLYVDDIQLYRL